jgi:hypothetical protein
MSLQSPQALCNVPSPAGKRFRIEQGNTQGEMFDMTLQPVIRQAAAVITGGLIMLSGAMPPVFAQAKRSEAADSSKKFDLTIDNIMRGNGLVGYEPRAIRWSGDSQRIWFQWKSVSEPREKDFDTWVVSRDGNDLKKLSEQEARNAPPVTGDRSKDKKLTLFVDGGDIYLYDNPGGQRRQITATTEPESNPRFARDQKRFYFTRGNNLFVMSLDSGSLVQMTDIRAGAAPPPTPSTTGGGVGFGRGGGRQARQDTSEQQKGTDSQEYLKKEEKDLLDVIKRRAGRGRGET